MNFKLKKSGFTLSEVMITLSLIGALASLTLTTIGSSVQQRARLAEFRTAYSKMDTTLKNIINDEGKIYACYTAPTSDQITDFGLKIEGNSAGNMGGACYELMGKFVRSMGVNRFCETNAVSEGCLPNNYPTNGNFNNYNSSQAYILDNGMIIFGSNGMYYFAVDVNGRKGPNKWGQDIFPFSTVITESKLINGTVFIKEVGILPPPQSNFEVQNPTKSRKTTAQMMIESAGRRN